MKVELNIDAGNLGETVVEMFSKLSDEKREEIAGHVLTEWLREPYGVEKHLADVTAIAAVRADHNRYSSRDGDNMSDDKCRNDYRYNDHLKKHKTTRQVMVETVTTQAIEHFKVQIAKEIASDPQIQVVLQETLAEIRTNYPKYVHDAMLHWFSQSMNGIASGVSAALFQSGQLSEQVKAIAQRVGV